jgi:hypothetical protein
MADSARIAVFSRLLKKPCTGDGTLKHLTAVEMRTLADHLLWHWDTIATVVAFPLLMSFVVAIESRRAISPLTP